MSDILITKTRRGRVRIIHAKTKDSTWPGTSFNVDTLDMGTVLRIREIAAECTKIADDLEQSLTEGVDW